MGRYRSKSCSNLSVSQIHHNVRLSHSITLISGLVQGGELVTVRAADMIKGMRKHLAHRQMAQSATRKIEEFQIQHPRGSGIVFPEVRRRVEEGLFYVE